MEQTETRSAVLDLLSYSRPGDQRAGWSRGVRARDTDYGLETATMTAGALATDEMIQQVYVKREEDYDRYQEHPNQERGPRESRRNS